MTVRAALLFALGAALLGQASCSVQSYCIDCIDAEGSSIDGSTVDAHLGPDAAWWDAGPPPDSCVPSGIEVCDHLDNDCNGEVDDGELAGVGATCSTDVGECVEGTTECVAGHIVCGGGGVLPTIELCDTLDNDCNGDPDDDNPEGGAFCGTDIGECHSGLTECTDGDVICVGSYDGADEACNGLDDDCDNEFDEDLGSNGSCGPAEGDEGECALGLYHCLGGEWQCVGAKFPKLEQCDLLDHDCDGNAFNGFDFPSDARNCGPAGDVASCGNVCADNFLVPDPHITSLRCSAGACEIAFCETGYWDANGTYEDGCEYRCDFQSSVDICNLADDDCDGETDEDATPPEDFCDPDGECASPPGSGTPLTPTCTADGWICEYDGHPTGGQVSTDGDNHIIAEASCDGRDNDCDGIADESFPQLDADCHDDGLGVCQLTGVYVCTLAGDDVECELDPLSGGDPDPETCNGLDDNCDGIVDNPDPLDPERVVDDMVHISHSGLDFYIHRYEASRPDSTDADQGWSAARACSNPGVLPWHGATFAGAGAACAVSGKRLCTAAEYLAACAGEAGNLYPYGDLFTSATCNTEPFDGDPGDPDDDDLLLPTGGALLATCQSDDLVHDLSGNLKEWTNDITGQTGDLIDIAVLRGGAYTTPAAGATCTFRTSRAAVTTVLPTIGFRCCSDGAP